MGILLDCWQDKKKNPNIPHHRYIRANMLKVEKQRLRECMDADADAEKTRDNVNELIGAIKNYNALMGQPLDFWGRYRHSFDAFFRDGANKPPPYEKYMPEMSPWTTLIINPGNGVSNDGPSRKVER